MKRYLGLRAVAGYGFRAVPFSLALVPLLASTAGAGVVVWTGAGGSSWANASWSPAGGPGTTDTASFTDASAVTFPGTVTSVLNANRTIGGLAFTDTAGHYHVLDLGGFTLNVAGSLNFNTDTNSSTTAGIRDGILNVTGASSNIYVGSAVSASGSGIADLSNLTSVGFTAQNFLVGASSAGSANGTMTLSASNTIHTQLIQVGAAATNSSDANGTLHLGLSNTIATGEFDIGLNNANASVTLVNGGSVTLGSAAARTFLQVGNNTVQTNGGYNSSLNLSGGTMHAYTTSLIVGENSSTAGGGGNAGNFTAGTGTIDIGGSGNIANFLVGYNISQDGAGNENGFVDFSSLSSLNASVNNFAVAVSTGNGGASGTVKLAIANTISANNITFGSGGGGSANVTLGMTNTISANQFTMAQDGNNSTLTLPAGGQLTLGSAAARTLLTLGNNTGQTNNLYSTNFNASAGTVNAYLSSLTVGQNSSTSGGGGNSATFTAGGGTIDIGTGTGSNVIIGNNTGLGGTAIGLVDFSAMSSVKMNVGNFTVGTALTGGSQGNIKLGTTNTITATNITVGSGGGSLNTLTLGQSNTILVNQFTIAKDYSSGAVTIPGGGSLTLGSAAQPANLSIAVGSTNTNITFSGSLDLTNATFTGYLGNVIIGNKDPLPGAELGTLTIGSSASNYIQANSIALGGPQSTGTINYGGGTFFAGSISKGAGSANFNWTGGTLSVGTFGTPATPFDLQNTGTGTLATGSVSGAIGTTNIYGNYAQGSAGTTAIRIAGDNPTTGNDQVNVSQTATLAGNLSLQLTNGFVPSVGQSFLIETYGTRSGTYSFVAPPTLPQNVAFSLDYTTNANQLNVRMVNPVPQSYTSTAASGTFGTASNWNTNAAPGTPSALTISNSTAGTQTVTVGASTTVHSVSLSGAAAPLNFDIPQGIKLGVAYQLLVGANSVLRGGGQVVGSVVVAGGTVSPDILTINGNYVAGPSSVLQINLNGAGAANGSELAVQDLLSLGGTLQVNLDGYTPAAGDSFKILSFGSVSGAFNSINLPSLTRGLVWDDSQLGTTGALTVDAVPEPAAIALLAIGCAGLLRRKRSSAPH